MGIEVVFNRAPELLATVEEKTEAAMLTAADFMFSYAAGQMGSYPPASAPGDYPAQRTGELATNVHAEPDGAMSVTAEWLAPYAHFVNYGTSRMAPRPFVEPSVDATTPVLEDLLAAVFDL